MTEQTPELILEEHNGIGLIILNRPKALNALSLQMIIDCRLQLEHWAKVSHIKGVIIRANGGRAFCAGGDVREIWNLAQKGTEKAVDYFREEYRLDKLIHDFPKPFIALIDGIWMGGGVGVSIHGNWRVVSERAIFAMPETAIGFVPDVGTSRILSKIPSKIGRLLALTGLRCNAADVLTLKLATNYVPSTKFDQLLDWLIQEANWKKPLHVQIRHIWYELPPEPTQFTTSLKRKIRTLFSGDTVQEIMEALEASHWEEAKVWKAMMEAHSPLAMEAALLAQTRASALSFDEVLDMELHLAHHAIQHGDMVEGVRAVIIDRDNQPNWRYNTADSVDYGALKTWMDRTPDFFTNEQEVTLQ